MNRFWIVLVVLAVLALIAGWFLTRPAFIDGDGFGRPPLLSGESISEEKETIPEVQSAASNTKVVVQSSLRNASEAANSTRSESGSLSKNEYDLFPPNPATLSGAAENQTELRLNILRKNAQGVLSLVRTYLVPVQGNVWKEDVPYIEDGEAFALGGYIIELVGVSGTIFATSSLRVWLVD